MIRKQGGLIDSFSANENVVDKCLEKIREVEPDSLADKLLHITIKSDPEVKFTMDGFEFVTDSNGNFSTPLLDNMKTVEIREIKFEEDTDAVLCFLY